jgi:hypothetical protein
MIAMSAQAQKPLWVYLVAVGALIGSVWVGWADFDPHVPQVVVQESIREAPRVIVQVFVQFVLPVALLGFLVKEAAAFVRSRRKA